MSLSYSALRDISHARGLLAEQGRWVDSRLPDLRDHVIISLGGSKNDIVCAFLPRCQWL
jgi:hypothetical protein